MASNPEPKIIVDGVEYLLLMPDDMKLGEQRAFEQVAGCGVDKIMEMDGMNAGIVAAWMAVSIHRAKPNTPIQRIVDRLDELTADELADAWANVKTNDDEDGPSPPAGPGSSANATSNAPGSVSVSEPTPGPATPNGSGAPGSAIGSASDQPTLVTSPPPS